MTEHRDTDDDWTLLFGGYTTEGLLSQCERWQEWMEGKYWSNCPRLRDTGAD
ncbi:hypothetical protein [Nocardia brasiliensis]|uniref:hypothetical protein n=1 Tax=Nocardia brasiliensis TaxID=37326 RepID=UPI002455A32F|nr:hypothetical protein [Nocardia brasiliensis]